MQKVINLESSKYHIEYDTDKEWDFQIFRGNENITQEMKNNLVIDMFYTITAMQENTKESKTIIKNGEYCCSKCNSKLGRKRFEKHFCPNCGNKINWSLTVNK